MVDDVRTKGAFPVPFTSVQRRRGRLEDTHGDYPGYTRVKVPLIDVLVSSGALMARLVVGGIGRRSWDYRTS